MNAFIQYNFEIMTKIYTKLNLSLNLGKKFKLFVDVRPA